MHFDIAKRYKQTLKSTDQPTRAAPVSVLSRQEARRIVAELLG